MLQACLRLVAMQLMLPGEIIARRIGLRARWSKLFSREVHLLLPKALIASAENLKWRDSRGLDPSVCLLLEVKGFGYRNDRTHSDKESSTVVLRCEEEERGEGRGKRHTERGEVYYPDRGKGITYPDEIRNAARDVCQSRFIGVCEAPHFFRNLNLMRTFQCLVVNFSASLMKTFRCHLPFQNFSTTLLWTFL